MHTLHSWVLDPLDISQFLSAPNYRILNNWHHSPSSGKTKLRKGLEVAGVSKISQSLGVLKQFRESHALFPPSLAWSWSTQVTQPNLTNRHITSLFQLVAPLYTYLFMHMDTMFFTTFCLFEDSTYLSDPVWIVNVVYSYSLLGSGCSQAVLRVQAMCNQIQVWGDSRPIHAPVLSHLVRGLEVFGVLPGGQMQLLRYCEYLVLPAAVYLSSTTPACWA